MSLVNPLGYLLWDKPPVLSCVPEEDLSREAMAWKVIPNSAHSYFEFPAERVGQFGLCTLKFLSAMRLSETVLRGHCLQKRLTVTCFPVALNSPRSPEPPVSHYNSGKALPELLTPLTRGQGGTPPAASTGKSTNGSAVRYLINPARHRHMVCTVDGEPSHTGPSIGHHQLHFTGLAHTPTLHPEPVGGACCVTFLQQRGPSHLVPMETSRVGHMTYSHLTKDQWAPVLDHSVNCKATPTPSPVTPQQSDSDMPSPAQLSVILLKLREEVRNGNGNSPPFLNQPPLALHSDQM